MKSLLVATDFSERSDRAIRRATLLARTYDAAVMLIHIVDDDQPKRLIKAEEQAASKLLEEQARSLREIDGLECEFRIALGDPFEKIMQIGREEDVDLVIIGPHRRQILKDVFVGTTAERIIRTSDRPVLMANAVPAGAYRQILIATDLSDCSGDALRAAVGLDLIKKSDVSVLHVFDAPPTGLMNRASLSDDQIQDYLYNEEQRASLDLLAFLVEHDLRSVPSILKPAISSVEEVILSAAREISAEVIIIGSRGKTGLAKTLLGSTAEKLLCVSDHDILVVPPRLQD
ncbi:universal stress protein [Sneathiella litorea]|uniref:Universal stress protein n=1 Tax=Sneathiella litorea TaxID=2606216 RepID=A0A6L8WD74_9PROT|nr:universal stress protein [Sneathiella litorea]MZR32390.1 universal stress protein [Sneathiella litorea]